MMDMHFNYKHLADFGYNILGLKTNSKSSCYHYVKYFDEQNSLVVFSTIHRNAVGVYKLTPQQYVDFKNGQYALSVDGQGSGKSPQGYPIKNYGYINVFSGGALSSRKELKKYLDSAEEIAKI